MATEEFDNADLERRMEGAIAAFKNDLGGLRTGRASAHLLDPIMVDAYGQSMPLNQVASVNVPEPRMIVVQVWDNAMVAGVEKAIRDSNIGINPVVDGTSLRGTPQGTGESRASICRNSPYCRPSCASRWHGYSQEAGKRRGHGAR